MCRRPVVHADDEEFKDELLPWRKIYPEHSVDHSCPQDLLAQFANFPQKTHWDTLASRSISHGGFDDSIILSMLSGV